jgi:hypothetical protein
MRHVKNSDNNHEPNHSLPAKFAFNASGSHHVVAFIKPASGASGDSTTQRFQ